jgi:hypothetical protein
MIQKKKTKKEAVKINKQINILILEKSNKQFNTFNILWTVSRWTGPEGCESNMLNTALRLQYSKLWVTNKNVCVLIHA